MSSEGLKKIARDILADVNKSAGGESKPGSSRNQVEKAKGQIFAYNKTFMYIELDKVARILDLPNLALEQKKIINKKWVTWLKNAGKGLSTRKKNKLQIDIDNLKIEYPTLDFYMVSAFNTVVRQKNDILAQAVEDEYRKTSAVNKAHGGKGIKESQFARVHRKVAGGQIKGEAEAGFQTGHGEYGLAASGITAARVQQTIQTADKSGLSKQEKLKLNRITRRYERKAKVKLDHRQVITAKGMLRKDYLLVLSLHGVEENQYERETIEEPARQGIIDDAKEILDNPTSTMLRDAISKVLLQALTKNTRKVTKIKYRGHRPKSKIDEKSRGHISGKVRFKSKFDLGIAKSLITMKTIKKIKMPKLDKKTASQGSPGLSLKGGMTTINQINTKLSEEIQKNMGEPGLVNRTGRFADSVSALRMVPGKGRQWPTLQYTYDRDPYGVFELGGGDRRWASKARDPRTLINKTIREVAREQALTRFKLQRV